MSKPGRNPDGLLFDRLADLDRRLRALERRNPRVIRIEADDGAYLELGVFADGSVGLRVYNNAGGLVHNYTAT